MAAASRKLDRPLLIIGGFLDPGVGNQVVRLKLGALTDDRQIVDVGMGDCFSFDDCRKKVIDAVEATFHSDNLAETVEVDVVGLSMGGLVARYAAMPIDAQHARRLRIARLFTISSPLAGADLAERMPAFHPLMEKMRPGSDFVKAINANAPTYPVFSYVRLGDLPVGAAHAALPGKTAWWLSTPPLEEPHCEGLWDPRILADIARRLRSEPPLTTEPPAPLPVKS